MSFYYGEQNRVQIEEAIKKNTVVILPIGTTEEHGMHLPTETDAIIAKYMGDRLGEAALTSAILKKLSCPILV